MSIMRQNLPVTTSGSSEDPPPAIATGVVRSSQLFSWRVLGGLFATMLVVGWIFIIVILIQEEKWQLVLVAWLLLYAAAHFCYWYFKRHHLLSIRSQLCRRVRGNVDPVGQPDEKGQDDPPPSYEEILKNEIPPPAYYSVIVETPKSHGGKRSPFSLPKVFGRSPGGGGRRGGGGMSPSSGRGGTTTKTFGRNLSPTISASITTTTTTTDDLPRFKPTTTSLDASPPTYAEHQPSTSRPPSSVVTGEPILAPIFNNIVEEDQTLKSFRSKTDHI